MPTNDSQSNDAHLENAPTDSEPHETEAKETETSKAETPETESLESTTKLDDQAAAEVSAARDAFDQEPISAEEEQLIELAEPFVGQWNGLISTTNWEKGRIIAQWREALIDSGSDATEYSDEAWTRRVGGVTSPHVGRLRRVYDRFFETYESYKGLFWSHFLAALDWDDAPLWLEGATKEQWSVAKMREQRWQAHGAVESNRPTSSQIIEVDTDEDVTLPAQGGGRTKEYGDDSGIESGPTYEGADFGEEEELLSLSGSGPGSASGAVSDEGEMPPIVQPFAGLAPLPDDLSDATETFKLAILRHKTAGWKDVDAETVEKYLQAFVVLLSQP